MRKDVSKFKFDEVEPMYDVIPPLRALALRDQDPALWKLFWNLMSHYDNWMKDPDWKISHQYIIDFLLDKLKVGCSIKQWFSTGVPQYTRML